MIEHDGSLSRRDLYASDSRGGGGDGGGDNATFAPEVWAAVASHFGGSETISIETAARARRDRLAAAPATNPRFDMGEQDLRFSLIETCLYLRVFGTGTEGHARTEWVRVLFGEFADPRKRMDWKGIRVNSYLT